MAGEVVEDDDILSARRRWEFLFDPSSKLAASIGGSKTYGGSIRLLREAAMKAIVFQ